MGILDSPEVGSGFGNHSGFLSGGHQHAPVLWEGTHGQGLETALSTVSHAHTHTPTYNMKAEEGGRRGEEGREAEGRRGTGEGLALRLGFQAHAPGAFRAAGGLGAAGRRRWSLVSSWGGGGSWEHPRLKPCAVSGVQSWHPVTLPSLGHLGQVPGPLRTLFSHLWQRVPLPAHPQLREHPNKTIYM